jgi:steroid delta-isomerase-like uncharacterized protein
MCADARHEPRLHVLDELATPEIAAGGKQYLTERRSIFPDLRYTVEGILAEDDRVVTRLTMRGTNLGPLRGGPPSGRRIEAAAVFIWRIADGRVVDMWSLIDHSAVERQLGIAPA